MKKIIIVVSIILSLVTSCKSQSCKDLPESFNSYSEAIDAIKAVSTVGAGGITSPKPTKAEIENEFNNINPMTQSEGERYEERIVQLQSAPLPCIDAATGLVHIVGRMLHNCFSSAYMHGQPLLNSATYNGMQSKPRIVL